MVLLTPEEIGSMKHANGFKKHAAGAESNVAIGLSRLGCNAGWFSKLGADPHGEYIRSFVRGEGVDTSTVLFDRDVPTGLMFKERRELGESHVYYYRHGSAASTIAPEDLPREYIANARYLHITGITLALSETCRKAVFEAIEIAAANDVLVSFDPNIRLKLWEDAAEMRTTLLEVAAHVDIVFLGSDEGELLFDSTDPKDLAEKMLTHGADIVVVTQGADGAFVVNETQSRQVDGHTPERVVDTIGAGDGFVAGFLAGQLQDCDLIESTKLANAVGAFATTVTGDTEGYPTREELNAFRGNNSIVRR